MKLSTPIRSAFAICFLLLAGMSYAQVIPQERRTDWMLSGIRDSAAAPTLFINFTEQGGKGDGSTLNDEAFVKILESIGEQSIVLFFPNGTYLFSLPLNLPSNFIIRGAGSDSTKLVFNLKKQDHLIKITGKESEEGSLVVGNIAKDTKEIMVESASRFEAGDYIRISDDDADLVTSEWALHTSGQIVRIERIEGNVLFLSSPVRRNYSASANFNVQRLRPAKHVGIENIGIVRIDSTEEQTSNIRFSLAADCWVKCIESEMCNFAHIEISTSTNIDISGSYLHHAFSYGGGGEGYGIVLQNTSGECRIQNSIFNTLRHSILLQAGANGNVIAYNYSINPNWTEPSFPKNYAGDIVLHGNYPYANLFEGNVVQNIVIDNSHGKNGMYNTFFRNRASLYGILMSDTKVENLNFLGNEITHPVLGSYFLQGTGHLQYGNNKSGKILPLGTDSLSDKSLYLNETPDYYKRRTAWPPVGSPNTLNAHKIQVQDNYLGGFFTPCLAPLDTFGNIDTTHQDTTHQDTTHQDTTSYIRDYLFDASSISVYPNPAKDFMTVALKNAQGIRVEELRVLTVTGQEIASYRNTNQLDIASYKDGVYLIAIKLGNGQKIVRKFVKAE